MIDWLAGAIAACRGLRGLLAGAWWCMVRGGACRLEVHLLTSWTDCSRKVKSLFFDNIASLCQIIANSLVRRVCRSVQPLPLYAATPPTIGLLPGVKSVGGGSHRISDPAPVVRDPLSLVTDPVPQLRSGTLSARIHHPAQFIFLSILLCA